MNVYDQIQDLAPGTEVTITLRGTVRDWGGLHFFEVGGSNRLVASLKHAESITVHEPVIEWQEDDVVQGPSGITFVRDEDGEWRFSNGNTSTSVTDRIAHAYTPVIREGKIVAQPELDHPKVGDTLTEEQIANLPTGSRVDGLGRYFSWERHPDGSWAGPDGRNTAILLDRPAPPRMDEPTRLGSVVVAGGPGDRRFIIRMGEFSSGPWHWRDSESEKLYRWDDLIDPRPATEQEVEERRVIEP